MKSVRDFALAEGFLVMMIFRATGTIPLR